jgi:hypothetical protein
MWGSVNKWKGLPKSVETGAEGGEGEAALKGIKKGKK